MESVKQSNAYELEERENYSIHPTKEITESGNNADIQVMVLGHERQVVSVPAQEFRPNPYSDQNSISKLDGFGGLGFVRLKDGKDLNNDRTVVLYPGDPETTPNADDEITVTVLGQKVLLRRGDGEAIPLEEDTSYNIGRFPTNDVMLSLPTSSRNHMTIKVVSMGIYKYLLVKDNKTKGGTFVEVKRNGDSEISSANRRNATPT